MKYKVTFKGGADGANVEDRIIEAAVVEVDAGMTKLRSAAMDKHVLLLIPNDRLISIEKIG